MKYKNCMSSGQFLMPDGRSLLFVHGMYETEDAKEIEQLDLCAKTQGTTISKYDEKATITVAPGVDVKPDKLAEAAAAILAQNAHAAQHDPKIQALLDRAKVAAGNLGAVTTEAVKPASAGG